MKTRKRSRESKNEKARSTFFFSTGPFLKGKRYTKFTSPPKTFPSYIRKHGKNLKVKSFSYILDKTDVKCNLRADIGEIIASNGYIRFFFLLQR